MARSYDRLTMLDNSFLLFESPQGAMHVASTQIHEAAPLRRGDGPLDIERIQEYVASRLDRIPRYRQRLAHTPIEGHPVWVDDPNFNIQYHVRHARLPRPGNERQLKRMIARIFSQQLDRGKPLWEIWVIEGLEGDRVALHSKVHHCMVDGVSGSELIAQLLTAEPQEKVEMPAVWDPRPVPSGALLAAGEIERVVGAPFQIGSSLLGVLRDEDHARHRLLERVRAAGRMIIDTASTTTPVPFNQPIGPYRRIDWMPMSLDRIRAIRQTAGGTVNDVVLATAAGGIGRYLRRCRGLDIDDVHFRVLAPVSVRAGNEKGDLGNRVSAWTLNLPIAEPDPLAQLANIHEQTETMKTSKRALGAEMLTGVTEWMGSGLLSLGSRIVLMGTPFNTVVTNIPGPRMPLYLLESRMLEIHPHVPLAGTMGLGIALFSYNGTISWGFSADWDLIPDLHDLALAVDHAFETLSEAANA